MIFHMAASNHRIREVNTYHHLISRIAHRVYFMKDEERNDFVEMMRRVADFSGIQLVAWCVLTNHFHIFAFLPEAVEIGEEEVLRRYGVLKGVAARKKLEMQLVQWRECGENGKERIQEELKKIKSRMYDIGEFMKILKQWFTVEYNRRYAHVGTLWESVYHDKVIKDECESVARVAGYIHLNPIRAAATDRFDGYAWSSFTALKRGDDIALKGMRMIYGEGAEANEIVEAHGELMRRMLEEEKQNRAMEIARKRAAGYEVPTDPLTDEAMIAQAAAHLEKVIDESVVLDEMRKVRGRPTSGREELERRIIELRKMNPGIRADAIAEATGRPISTVYLYLKRIKQEEKF